MTSGAPARVDLHRQLVAAGTEQLAADGVLRTKRRAARVPGFQAVVVEPQLDALRRLIGVLTARVSNERERWIGVTDLGRIGGQPYCRRFEAIERERFLVRDRSRARVVSSFSITVSCW
jgi:hypothetical protein